MVFKTFFMLSLYIVPYVLILTCNFSSISVLLMWALIGFGMSGIGLSIMHDANHNAYSKNKNVNKLNLVGEAKIIFFSNDTKISNLFKFWNLKKSFRLERLFKTL